MIDGLSFRHLQLDPDLVAELEGFGLRQFGDLADAPPESRAQCRDHPDVCRRAELAAMHLTPWGIDWSGFWNEDGVTLHWMAMSFAADAFEEQTLDLPLESLSALFGALLNIPRAHGLHTLRDVVSVYENSSLPWRGFGAGKVARLGAKLQDIAERRIALQVPSPEGETTAPTSLPSDILAWGIDALGLGAAAMKLKRNGYNTLASLQVEPAVLWTLPGVGKRTVSLAKSRLSRLAQATKDGKIDLDRLAGLEGLEIIPATDNIEGRQLSELIHSVLRSVAEADGSDAAMPILDHRICTGGSDEATLDDIAAMLPVRITRERVRQIEKRMLDRAAELLLSPHPVLDTVIVRPILRDRFRDLAEALEGREHIGPDELALLISNEWRCGLTEAVRVLPMVMAVIEGTARTFAELRRLVDAPVHLLHPLETIAGSWPAQNIGAERPLALKLEAMGIRSLEDMRLAWIGGSDFGRHEEYVQSTLAAASPRYDDETAFADRLGDFTGRPVVPSAPNAWAGYIEMVSDDIAAVIGCGTFWSDAEIIFRQRTSALPAERITMDALGGKLGRLGVTVKRTESETLARLASAVLEGREGYAQCIFRPDWLAMWQELRRLHECFPGDQKTFGRSIAQLHGIKEEAVTMAMPAVWAILTGLPTRQSHGRSRVELEERTSVLAPVRLAGFRTLH